jgi:hypothetical protein
MEANGAALDDIEFEVEPEPVDPSSSSDPTNPPVQPLKFKLSDTSLKADFKVARPVLPPTKVSKFQVDFPVPTVSGFK